MMNKSKLKRFLILSLATFAFVLLGGNLNETKAQCAGNDPFCKPTRATPKQPKPTTTGTTTTTNTTGSTTTTKPVPVKPQIVVVPAPSAEQRIAYYKNVREQAALRGEEIPKVTSVLLIDEMSVTGIFRTPRGFAAMVEAKPISLSYTIYPGDKFFDGQLVAIEENRLVFRRITKMSNNKFVTSVENKTLRQYTDQEVVQGTAPVTAQTQTQTQTQTSQTENGNTNTTGTTTTQSDIVISPLDEMNRQQQTEQQETKPTTKPTKKPRVSKKGK
ncbi:MAG TPA: hypothetical protein PKE69_24475 [Pyrinomonadaceae bacterium]|nr:hypothetical protein [Pyrinomonadaceae bacterium]